MLLQSLPGGGAREQRGVHQSEQHRDHDRVLTTTSSCSFRRPGAFPAQKVVLHVEPDFWGLHGTACAERQRRRRCRRRSPKPASPQLAGLPSNVSGFARAIVKPCATPTRRTSSLGYHISVWGTNVDIALSNPPDAMVDALGTRARRVLHARSAPTSTSPFAEFSDRDSAFYQFVYGDGGRAWWDAEDFRRNVRFLRRVLDRWPASGS